MRIGSLFSGYGGLDMAIRATIGGHVVWHCEFDQAPARVLAHHAPRIPNLGDITDVDWADVEPVDILTGGFPCQDVSSAGQRKGLRPGTRSGLWTHMAYAIDQLRPGLVVIENVRGLLNAGAHSDVEPCPWCVGGTGNGEPVLRALGAVLGDLADLGYDAEWVLVRASDVGAPHRRERVFIVAHPATANPGRSGGHETVEHDGGRPEAGHGSGVPHQSDRDADGPGPGREMTFLPTPSARDWKEQAMPPRWRNGARQLDVLPRVIGKMIEPSPPDQTGALLPTPVVSDANGAGAHGNGGVDLRTAMSLLPTPKASDGPNGGPGMLSAATSAAGGNGRGEADALPGIPDFGPYAPAVARWEAVLGRPAPSPTEPGKDGRPRLSPRFVEWMMGLPDGHVTDPAIGLTRAQQLKILGNGVVPQQAAYALRTLMEAR